MTKKCSELNKRLSIILIGCMLFQITQVNPFTTQKVSAATGFRHQKVGNDVMLGGNYIEVGISKSGSFGTESEAPSGFHPTCGGIGLSVDGDGFDTGNAPTTGDFFLPGSPEESFTIGYKVGSSGAAPTKYTNAERRGETSITTSTSDISSSDTLSALTAGTTSDNNLAIQQKVSFKVNDKFFKNTVTYTNKGTSTLYDVRYMRSFDPDQDAVLHSSYETYNSVLENFPQDKRAIVRATGAVTKESVFFISLDDRARASTFGFANRDPYVEEAYNTDGSKLETPESLVDQAIAITFALGDLAPGQSTTFEYYTSLDPNYNSGLAAIMGSLGLQINNGAATTNSLDVTLNLSGDNVAQMCFSNDNFTWSSWEPYASTKTWTLTAGEGTKTVYAQFKDSTGNVSNVNDSIEYTNPDSTAPTFSVSGNPTTWTTSNVTLTVNALDAGSGLNTSGAYSYDNGSTWTTSNTQSFSANGTVNIKVKDNVGNISSQSITIDKIDKTAPTFTSISTTPAPSTWTNNGVTLTVNGATDNGGSELNPSAYSFSTTQGDYKWQTSNVSSSFSENQPVYVYVRDTLDNISTASTVNISAVDKTLPEIASVAGNPSDWTKDSVTLTVNASDAVSGLAAAAYSFDGGSTWQTEKTKTYDVNTNGIVIKVKDNAGNIATYSTIDITKIDKTAPQNAVIWNASSYVDGKWFNEDQTINASFTSTAGCAEKLQYKLNTADWVDGTSVAITTEGQYTVSFRVIDYLGRTSESETVKVNLDKTKPTNAKITIKDKSFTSFLNTITFGIFFKDTADVAITADSNISGVKKIEYQKVSSASEYKPDGTWTSGDSLNVNPNDKFVIYARITDNADNYVIINSDGVIVDATTPELTLTPDTNGWSTKNVNVKIAAADALAGINEVNYSTDETVPQTGTVTMINGEGNITLSNEGQYVLTVKAKDNSLNVVTQTADIKIDKTLPENASVAGNPSDWTKDSVTLTVNASDAVSGLAAAAYSFDGGSTWQTEKTKTYDVNTNGIVIKVKDNAGNIATYSTIDITKIDKTAPQNAVIGNASSYVDGKWFNEDQTINASFTITAGCSERLQYKVYTAATESTAAWKDGESVAIDAEGQYTVSFRVIDDLNRTSAEQTVKVNVDKTAPTDLTISLKENSFKKFLNKITFGMFSKDSVDVNITTDSNISGTNYIEYQLVDTSKGESYDAVNGKWVKYTSLSISPQFKGVIYARAMDKAGNLTAVVNSDGLTVDNVQPTSPVITATVDGNPYAGEWTSKDVVISASGASALAGIDHYEYKFGTDGTWITMPNQTGAVDATSGKTINDKMTITEPVGGTYYFRAVSSSGVIGEEITKVVKHENTVPTTKVTSAGKVDAWTKDSVKFNVSNTNENILCPVTSWIKIGNGDWTKITADDYTFDAEINEPVRFKTVIATGLENIDPKTYNVMIDKTAPVISGAEEGKTYYIGRVITIDDNSKAACTSVYKLNNGSDTNLTSGALISGAGSYGIKVTDQAGNVSTLGFTVKALPTVADVLYTSEWDNLIKNIRSEFYTHNDLPEPYKTNTDNAIKALENRFKFLDTEVKTIKQEVVGIKSDVSKLPAVNDGLIAMLDTIQNEYDKIAGNSSTLTTEEKAVLVSEKNDLKQLLDTLKALKDKNADIITRANAIPTADDGLIAQRDAIKAILDEIAGLTNEQKTILKPTIDALNALLDKAKALQDKVEEEKAKADALPTADDGLIAQKDNILKVLDEISKLTPEQKGLLKEKTDALNALLDKAKALQTKVDDVKTKAEAALKGDGGLVSQRDKIKALLDEISKLTPEQKSLLKQQIDSLTATLQSDMEKLKGLDEAAEKLQILFAVGDNADSVTKAMFLANAGSNGTSITWNSSDTNIVTDAGRVTRPDPKEQNKTITLTASIRDPKTNEVIKKQFKLTVKKLSYLEAACKQLTPECAFTFDSTGDTWESVTNKFLLLGKGAYDSTITWTSSKPSIINITSSGNEVVGTVTRPENQDEDVILTATITKDGATATKTFLMSVKQKNVTKQSASVRVETNTDATLESSSNAAPVSVNIKRTTLDNSQGIIDTLIVTEKAITALTDNINPLAQAAERTVTINMPQPTDGTAKATEQAVEIPASAVQAMAERNAVLEVKMGEVKIQLNTDELKELNNRGTDLYFKVVPIKDATEQSKLSTNTKANGAVMEIAKSLGNGVAVPQGVPYTVETNYSGFNTKLLVPFTGMTIPTENRTAFLASLRVYIEHTDGTKEAKGGTIVYKDGIPVGIEITIDRFSSFQIFSVEQPKANTALPKTGSIIDFTTILALGALLMLTGFGLLRYRRKKTDTNKNY